MKKITIALVGALAFASGVFAASCTKDAYAAVNAEELTISQLKSVIYEYQRICDHYISDEMWGDVVAEGQEWSNICEIVGSPYRTETPVFWVGYTK